jgi:penicillin-binding protein 1A
VGSAFKPFVYTVAIDNGYSPVYELLNQPVTIMMPDGKRWTPSNFDGSFGGKSTIREAIKHSINLVAVRAILEIAPVDQVIGYAKRMGITSPLPAVASLALGVGEVSPLEMAAAFSVFADRGVHVEPVFHRPDRGQGRQRPGRELRPHVRRSSATRPPSS